MFLLYAVLESCGGGQEEWGTKSLPHALDKNDFRWFLDLNRKVEEFLEDTLKKMPSQTWGWER